MAYQYKFKTAELIKGCAYCPLFVLKTRPWNKDYCALDMSIPRRDIPFDWSDIKLIWAKPDWCPLEEV